MRYRRYLLAAAFDLPIDANIVCAFISRTKITVKAIVDRAAATRYRVVNTTVGDTIVIRTLVAVVAFSIAAYAKVWLNPTCRIRKPPARSAPSAAPSVFVP